MTNKRDSSLRIKKIKKILPDIFIYHYFDWKLSTESYGFPSDIASLDYPSGIKSVLWYDDLHDNITHKVGEVIRKLYYPKEKDRKIWFDTVKALSIAELLDIPDIAEWYELAEELGIEREDLDYYKKWQEARKYSEMSHVASFISYEAVNKTDSFLFEAIKQQLINKKNKSKRKKGQGFGN